MYERIATLSVLMGASLMGCSFEQHGYAEPGDGAAASEENVGSVSSPLNAAPRDRQPAAVALRGVRTTVNGVPTSRKDLYVFICDNHQLKVRTKGLFGWNFGGWQAIAPDYPCDSAPTVGIIRNTEANKQDILAVYWRSEEKLMEAWYRKNGTMAVLDMKDYDPGNVPAIEGSPMVSDTSDPTKVQVVVKRDSSPHQIWTIQWTGSVYDAVAVKRADGTVATTSGNDFYTAYNAGYGREYISAEDGFDHVIYSRPPASWGTSYTPWAKVTSAVNGLLSIGGHTSTLNPNCQRGFAMRLLGVGIEAACLDAGGTLTNWEQVGPGGSDNTVYGAPSAETEWLYGLKDGFFWLYSADPLIALGTLSWDASGATSAIVQVKGGEGYVFWAKSVDGIKHLMMADYSAGSHPTDATITDLGGNLFY
jgi:hypothetical protein